MAGGRKMRELIFAASAALFLVSCSSEAPTTQNEAEPETLTAGQYQASWKVAQLRGAQNATPATNLKANGTGTTVACVGDDGSLDLALFAEDGDTCTASNAYVRNGRISIDVTCKREGATGEVRQSVSGSYTKSTLEAEVSTTTYLGGSGNYTMTRTFSGKRVGKCPPATESAKKTS
jgi:outer membrane murein-binding lipoprotein Lpp